MYILARVKPLRIAFIHPDKNPLTLSALKRRQLSL